MSGAGETGRTLAVGFFDGVHLGHRRILSGADAALTFRNHPTEILRPASVPALIMDFDARVAAIRSCGVREVVALDFTRELADTPAEDFLPSFAGFARVRCGANWRFGRGGAGDAAFLRAHGFAVDVVPYAEYGGAPVSSTRIRAALAAGDLAAANAMLGSPLSARGRVVAGKGLGRGLGFPTVNVALDFAPPVPRGVYAVESGGARGVANYGVAPTLGAAAWPQPVLEIHFAETPRPAPEKGESKTVSFLRFIRREAAFASLEDLRRRIAEDCRAAGFEAAPA